MESAERLRLRHLEQNVHAETDGSRLKIVAPNDIESLGLPFGMTGLVEEIGKLARCFNKLVIAEHSQIRSEWETEADHRIVTSISVLERLYIKMQSERGK